MTRFIAISFMNQKFFRNVAKILDRLFITIEFIHNDEIAKSETDFLCSTNTGGLISASVTVASDIDSLMLSYIHTLQLT